MTNFSKWSRNRLFCLELTQFGWRRSRLRDLELLEPEPLKKVAAPQHCLTSSWPGAVPNTGPGLLELEEAGSTLGEHGGRVRVQLDGLGQQLNRLLPLTLTQKAMTMKRNQNVLLNLILMLNPIRMLNYNRYFVEFWITLQCRHDMIVLLRRKNISSTILNIVQLLLLEEHNGVIWNQFLWLG